MAIGYTMYGGNGITQSPTENVMAGGNGAMGSPFTQQQPPTLGAEAGASRFSRAATPANAPGEATVVGEGKPSA